MKYPSNFLLFNLFVQSDNIGLMFFIGKIFCRIEIFNDIVMNRYGWILDAVVALLVIL